LTHEAFPFDKMVSGMLDPEMIEDTAKIVNEAMKDEVQVNLMVNNRAGGNAALIPRRSPTGSIHRSSRGSSETFSKENLICPDLPPFLNAAKSIPCFLDASFAPVSFLFPCLLTFP